MVLALTLVAAYSLQAEEPAAPRAQETVNAPAPAKARRQDPQEEPPPGPRVGPAPKGPKEETRWRFRAGLDVEYNSNILRLDDRDVERLEDGTKPEKFRIDQPDDFIYAPWVEAAFTFPLLDGSNTTGLRFRPYLYQTNTIANYEEFTFFYKRDPVTFEYTLLPDVYRQEYKNLDTGEYESAFYREHDFELSARFAPAPPMTLKPVAGLRYRDYDSPFNHRDALGYLLGAKASVAATDWLEFGLEYEFFLNDAFASSFQPDTSYIANGLEPGVAVKPAKGLELALRYRYENRQYTTDNSEAVDPGHAGRTDDRHRWTFRTTWKVTSSLTLEAEYCRTDVDSNLPGDPSATDEETEWSRDEYILGIVYQF
jgi:hypothetical protein